MRLNAPKCQPAEMGFYLGFYWSGCRDLNSGPSVPQTDALTKLRHSPLGSGHSTGVVRWQVPLSAVR